MGLRALNKLKGFMAWTETVGFKALIETDGIRSMKLSMSRTRLTGVGLVQ